VIDMQSATRDPQAPLSVDAAWDEVTRLPGFDPNLKIQAIKELRARTGLSLREAKHEVDERLGVSLEAIMADLKSREGRELDEPTTTTVDDPWQVSVPEPNGHKAIDPRVKVERRRESNREASRRYRARIRAEREAVRPPVQPSHEDLAWALVGAIETPVLRGLLAASGFTIVIVRKAG
jgi:hypothetical protein